MSNYLYLNSAPTTTLAEVRESVEADPTVVAQVSNREVHVDLVETNTIRIGEGIELPATNDAINALGSWLDIPSAFLQRQDTDLQQHLISTLLLRQQGTGAFVYTPVGGLKEVREPGQRVIPVERLLDVASRVIDPEARVVESRLDADEFHLDVIVPENFDRGIGGDPQVGDISAGGIRIGQNRKQNLAPWVQPFQYRLRCTNGLSASDDGLKVDARGSSVEEVLAEFEAAADRAFRRVESDMEAFYAMRTERVENVERELLRLGTEAGMPVRTITRLQERVPLMTQALADEGQDYVSRFDLVNLITNQANDPRLRNRAGARAGLQQVGGEIVSEHATRCNACSSRLLAH